MQNVLIVVLARTGSSRFPNKILQEIEQLPSIIYQINRIEEAIEKGVSILVATTINQQDDKLCAVLNNYKIPYFRGSEKNVLQRFLDAARSMPAKYVMRINGDCPLICPKLIKKLINQITANIQSDYMSTIVKERFAIGMHLEIMKYEILAKMEKMASTENEIEHVTPVVYNNPNIFSISCIENDEDDSDLRITLDYVEDLEVIKEIAAHFKGQKFYYPDIVDYLRNHKHLIDKIAKYHKKQKVRS